MRDLFLAGVLSAPGSPAHNHHLGSAFIRAGYVEENQDSAELHYSRDLYQAYVSHQQINQPSLRGLVRDLCGSLRPAQNLQVTKRHLQNSSGVVQNRPEIIGVVHSITGSKSVQPKKKGAAGGRALWLCASVDHSSGVSDFLRRCRRFISPLTDVTTKLAVLSPSSFTFSSSSITSSGMRDTICCDLLLREPVAITEPPCNRWHSVYVKNKLNQRLKWHSLGNSMVNATCDCAGGINNEARRCHQHQRASNHNVTETYTMAETQHTQTRPKYQYRFMALLRADMTAVPCRLTIEATSEQEARQQLSGRYILSFAGCIPAPEVRYA
jgi:hypothetical protein